MLVLFLQFSLYLRFEILFYERCIFFQIQIKREVCLQGVGGVPYKKKQKSSLHAITKCRKPAPRGMASLHLRTFESVPVRCSLFTGTVPVRCSLFAGTVPVMCFLYTGTVPADNLFLKVMHRIIRFDFVGKFCNQYVARENSLVVSSLIFLQHFSNLDLPKQNFGKIKC